MLFGLGMGIRAATDNALRLAGSGTEPDPGAVDVTILFCDIVKSTDLMGRLGDRAAYAVVRRFHGLIEQCADRCEGKPIEVRGDGVLIAFDEPGCGLGCAIAIQQGLAEQGQHERLNVRVGIHAGHALRVPVGYFGSTVTLSARIAACAGPGEILVSGALRERVREADAFEFDAERWLELKGFPQPSQVFAVVWRPERASRYESRRGARGMPSAVSSERYATPTTSSGILGGAWPVPG